VTDPVVITRAQVAEVLGISLATFTDRVGEMRREHRFPLPLPSSGGRRYARAAVVAWINGRTGPAPNADMEMAVSEVEAILMGRARSMAAG